MDKTSELVLSEFYNSAGYFDRILLCLENNKQIFYSTEIKTIFYLNFIEIKSTVSQFGFINTSYDDKHSELIQKIKNLNLLFEQIIRNSNSQSIQFSIYYINNLYKLCFDLHQYISTHIEIEISLPSTLLAQPTSIKNAKNEDSIELFSIDENELKSKLNNNEESIISFIKIRREEKHSYFIRQGQNFILSNRFEEAKESFLKARNYLENAETLTLIAWAYSLLDSIEMAKKYCAKAIQLDSNYGPAFNDFGNYLILEGKIHESIKWFEQAKRALNYPQREYPYINAGRAYVMLDQFEDALREFSLALALAPHHNELHNTIIKLKSSILTQTITSTSPN